MRVKYRAPVGQGHPPPNKKHLVQVSLNPSTILGLAALEVHQATSRRRRATAPEAKLTWAWGTFRIRCTKLSATVLDLFFFLFYSLPPTLPISPHPYSYLVPFASISAYRWEQDILIATTASVSSPFRSMNISATEHDYRFPRRPYGGGGGSGGGYALDGLGPQSASSPSSQTPKGKPDRRLDGFDLDLSLALDQRPKGVHDRILTSAAFPPFQQSATMAADNQNLDQIRSEDPLVIQMWKFFHRTKQSLPNQERMENLSWRLMAMNLRKMQTQQEAEMASRYDKAARSVCVISAFFCFLLRPSIFAALFCHFFFFSFFPLLLTLSFVFPLPLYHSLNDQHIPLCPGYIGRLSRLTCPVMQTRSSPICFAADGRCQRPQWHRAIAKNFRTGRLRSRSHDYRRLLFFRNHCHTGRLRISSATTEATRRFEIGPSPYPARHSFCHPYQIPQGRGRSAAVRPPIRSLSPSPSEGPRRIQLCATAHSQDEH